jgi:hypothetical protein
MDSAKWAQGVVKGGAGQQRYAGLDGPCWIWNGPMNHTGGYGMVAFRGERYAVHRVALIVALGRDIRADCIAGHRCHDAAVLAGTCRPGICYHRRCVNPSHLAEQQRSENSLVAIGAGYIQRALAEQRAEL